MEVPEGILCRYSLLIDLSMYNSLIDFLKRNLILSTFGVQSCVGIHCGSVPGTPQILNSVSSETCGFGQPPLTEPD